MNWSFYWSNKYTLDESDPDKSLSNFSASGNKSFRYKN